MRRCLLSVLGASLGLASALGLSQLPLQAPSSRHLLMTAITHHDDPPFHSRIQCVNLTSHAFHTYPTVGESVYLSTLENATYVALPPASAEGWHRPPAAIFFVLLSGLALVGTPHTGQQVWIRPGENQIVLALDTKGRGHQTFYPSAQETLALQLPLAEAADLKLEVVAEEAC